ncbi:MAG TPA: NUDIX domain-containing protein [Devosia sp.]|jgi:predicted NUDIX family NTP pyrophosphohydrolase|uniref:NUDIX domain-containing protein n=1 Tax=Devosia sp. TaxID=1871048 RepID=UPI002DDDBA85|nr:NUDIX domain-containing protein [Devosia sp.]HEV2516620.1 NUDIX domain-containing protein [Devosia sp.]
MPKISAGILLHRLGVAGRELLLVHPGGPFWTGKDLAAWSIPKGLIEPGEDYEAAARREFAEEVGAMPTGDLVPLGEFSLSGGKRLVAFALEGDFDPRTLVSNSFEMEWPPHSGRRQTFPEVDRAEWFGLDAARTRLHLPQQPLADALRVAIDR